MTSADVPSTLVPTTFPSVILTSGQPPRDSAYLTYPSQSSRTCFSVGPDELPEHPVTITPTTRSTLSHHDLRGACDLIARSTSPGRSPRPPLAVRLSP